MSAGSVVPWTVVTDKDLGMVAMKVWVVKEFEDRNDPSPEVMGVFSSEEKARAYQAEKPEGRKIFVMTVDEPKSWEWPQ